MPKKSTEPITSVYQLKITLHRSKPPIWRRVLVPGTYTLGKLHHVIQRVMRWEGYHLHQFIIELSEWLGIHRRGAKSKLKYSSRSVR